MNKPFASSLLILVVLLNCSCKKEETKKEEAHIPVTTETASGLPDNLSINGYFYANCYTTYNGTSAYKSLNFVASFGDPARELLSNFNHIGEQQVFSQNSLGNVSVGNVRVAGYGLTTQNSGNSIRYAYNNSYVSNFSYSASFVIDGNGPFKPMDVTLPRGFPRVTLPTGTLTLSKSSGGSIDVSGFINNYDSVAVRFTTSTLGVRKVVDNPRSVFTFSSQDLGSLSTGNYQQIYFQAYNYSHKIIEDKSYVFELSDKASFYITITP